MFWRIQLKERGENNHGETRITQQGECPVSSLLVCQKKPEGEVVVFRHLNLVYKWKELPV